MKTAILTIGTEILFGQITNTNTVYLSQQLNHLGYDVMYHLTVGDNPQRVKKLIVDAFKEVDLILTTGGLGPTQDDLTKEMICEVFEDELVLHEPSMRALEDNFAKRGYVMTENNIKQAYMPSRAVVLDNDAGTAPGFALEKDGKIIISMPGPPREMKRMFELKVLPFLKNKQDSVIAYRLIKFMGIGESSLETELLEFIDGQTDPTLATYAKEGECYLRIASKRATEEEAMETVNAMLERVKAKLGKYIYSCDNEEFVDVVVRKLMENGLTLSSAESCTGGMFAQTITDVPGVSSVFDRGLVTYSNRAKMEELGVRPETLERYGAVSEETAVEMARGLQRVTGSDLCIAVTGIAGPGGGTEEKPVGLVYMCLVYGDKCVPKKVVQRNVGRKAIRERTVLNMLSMVYKMVREIEEEQ